MATIISSHSLNNINTVQNSELGDRHPSGGDIDIAEELLVRPRIPTRKYSLDQFAIGNNAKIPMHKTMDDRAPSFETTEELPQQFVIQTSNTWTSSSGDAPSDLDDVDKCSAFIEEYNRLATKVSFTMHLLPIYSTCD